MKKGNILILGGNSKIAQALSYFLSDKGYNCIKLLRKKSFSNQNNEIYYSEINKEIIFSEKISNIKYIINCIGTFNKNADLEYVNCTLPIKILNKINEFKSNDYIFIQLSSLSIYGNVFKDKENLIDESTEEKPTTKYGKSKLKFDNYLIKQKNINSKFTYLILRIPLIFSKSFFPKFYTIIKKLIKYNLFFYLKDRESLVNHLSLGDLCNIVYLLISNETINEKILIVSNCKFRDFIFKKLLFFNNVVIPNFLVVILKKLFLKLNYNIYVFNLLLNKTKFSNEKLFKEIKKTYKFEKPNFYEK